ncbi:uncharacterized protein JCM15063_003247 [Sporobolomyces koalae]|uniref:uncharacterized protein n=1 Tax=Sporobolomyces koalae TaxID=500713 RepID=UPI0031762572
MPPTPRTPSRSSSAQDAATTPHRRSTADLLNQLNSLFDSLPSTSNGSSSRPSSPGNPEQSPTPLLTPRTAPLRLLPDLLAAFEHKRGIEILSSEEKDQLIAMVAALPQGMEEQPVGVEEVMGLLVKMGVSGNETPKGPAPAEQRADSMTFLPADGSPVPRHRRTTSSTSTSSVSSNRSSTLGSPARPTTPLARPSLIPQASPAARRRSLMSSVSRSSGSITSPSTPGGSRTLRKKRTFDDLSNLIIQQGGKYLGVGLDGATGSDWDVGELSLKVKSTLSTKGTNRDRDLSLLLAPLTFPQLKSLNQSYASYFGKPLLDVLTQDKTFKGSVEFLVQGLLVGPLAWDVHLLQLALGADKVDDGLLVELLVGRSPSALALLRAAYSHRSTLPSYASLNSTSSSSTASPAPSSTSKSLDVAVLSAFSSGQLRLRKAWEVALQGTWADLPASSDSFDEELGPPLHDERTKMMVREDLDQLKVALRRGGNTEIVSKILFARSPTYLGELNEEYRKSTGGHASLTKAIKQCVGPGTLQKMFLHVVEGGKRQSSKGDHTFDVTIRREAKRLEQAIEKQTKDTSAIDEVSWRIARLHWDRSRAQAVQDAYLKKYSRSVEARLTDASTPSPLCDILSNLLESAALPEPATTQEDQQRLEKQSIRDRTISADGFASSSNDEGGQQLLIAEASPLISSESESELAPVKIKGYESGHSNRTSGSEVEAGELEADGEMSDPPSPRSPPPPPLDDEIELETNEEQNQDDVTPNVSTFSTFESQSDLSLSIDPDERDLSRSTSALSFTDAESPLSEHAAHRRSSSSLSNRSRSSALANLKGPRPPPSGAGNAGDRSIASLRHSRPVAPSRARRRQSEETSNRERAASTEPLSPTDAHAFAARSPTPSSRSRSSLGQSLSNDSLSLADTFQNLGSPGVDETSFHPAPLSPVGDYGPSSSSFSSNFPGFSPAPASPIGYDRNNSSDLFSTVGDSPGYLGSRRHSSSGDSITGSRPSSLFGNSGFLNAHSRDGSLINSEQVQMLMRQASELQKKLKDAEARLQTSASAFENDQSDLEARLEEVRAELHAKRKEEKELRNNEKQHLGQISSLEGDISKLSKSLDKSRENCESMKRNYTETCEEAERLRTLVAEMRRDYRAAEDSIQGHALQIQHFERDRELLQQGINKLEEDLEVARKAQDALDEQKQENLVLKETIDRLRFDLDEMRAANRKSGFLEPGATAISGSPGKSLGGSLSRSLGKELGTQLETEEDGESSEEEETEIGEEGEDEIIVTTHRQIKKRNKNSNALVSSAAIDSSTMSVVCDADIQTDEIAMRTCDAQTELSGIGVELVIATPVEPPKVVAAAKSAKERKEDAARELGIDIDVVRQYLDAQRPSNQRMIELATPTNSRRAGPGRWRSRMLPLTVSQAPSLLVSYFPRSARPLVGQILDSGVTLMLYTATIYLFGVLTGAHLLPVNHYHMLTPFSSVLPSYDAVAYNAMSWEGLVPGMSGTNGLAREGIAQFFYDLVWHGVQISKRVPV